METEPKSLRYSIPDLYPQVSKNSHNTEITPNLRRET